jgi:hypothetical protein
MSYIPEQWPITLACGCQWTAYNTVAYCSLHGAAPELLAALEQAFPTTTSGAMFIDEEVVKTARAAIAKATGSPGPASLPVTEKG